MSRLPFSPKEARLRARALLRHSPDDTLRQSILRLVYSWSMLTGDQLRRWAATYNLHLSPNWHTFDRSLSKFVHDACLDVLPNITADLHHDQCFPLFPCPPTRNTDLRQRAYRLGQVGEAYIAELQTPTPNLSRLSDQLHNILCAEVLLRIVEANPQTLKARGPRSILIPAPENRAVRLAPDALLSQRHADKLTHFWLVEFMNERQADPARLKHKFSVYHDLLQDSPTNRAVWQSVWQTDTPPSMLVIYRTPGVLAAMRDAAQRYLPHQSIWGVCLTDALGGFPLNWHLLSKERSTPDPTGQRPIRAQTIEALPPSPRLPPRARRHFMHTGELPSPPPTPPVG